MPNVERTEKTEEAFATLERMIKPDWYGRIVIIIRKGKIISMGAIPDPK